MAAWLVALLCRRAPLWLVSLVAAAVLFLHVPVAAEGRLINELTLTRQAAQTWRYFAQLHDKNIMVVTDRPGLFTVMDYGAADLSVPNRAGISCTSCPAIFTGHVRHSGNRSDDQEATARFEIWPERQKENRA